MKSIYTKLNYIFTCAISALLLVMGASVLNQANAQPASSYGFQAISGTYTQITGTSLSSVQGDDYMSVATPIGFSFNYCGGTYTQFRISSNGFLTFNTSNSSSMLSNSSGNLSYVRPGLMYNWDDMNGNIGTAVYAVSGTAPNRVLTIQLTNWKWNWSSSPASMSFQIKLYEATGIIDYVYRQESYSGNPGGSGGSTIGICDNSTYKTINNSSASPTASSSTFTTNINSRPATGQIYRWSPPANCSTVTLPSLITLASSKDTICINNPINLTASITLPPTIGVTYQFQYSASSSGPWTNIGTASTSMTAASNPLTGPTYFRVQALCNGNAFATSTPILVETISPVPPIVTDGTRCGIGTVDLLATANPGLNINWYDSPTAMAPINTGSTYTTPLLTGSTTYYVASSAAIPAPPAWVGTGTSNITSTPSPYYTTWWGNKDQYLVLASELTAAGFSAGSITEIGFNLGTSTSSLNLTNFTIKMKLTNQTALTNTWETGLTTVYTHPSYNMVANSVNVHVFQTPFAWDGVSNLIVETCFNNSGWNGTQYVTGTTGLPFTASHYYYADNSSVCSNPSSGYTTTTRPNMRFAITGCESGKVPINATVVPAPPIVASSPQAPVVCTGLPATLEAASSNNDYGYSWNPSGLQGASVVVMPSGPTTLYTVSAVDSVVGSPYFGCYAEDTIRINTTNGPAAVISPNILPTVCPGTPQLLSANSGTGLTYQWSFNNVPISGATGISYSATQSGTYTVTVDNGQCDSTSTPVIKADHNFPTSSLTYNSPLEFCEGSSVVLTSQFGSGLSYQWYKDGIAIPNGVDSFYEALTSGTYYVIISNGNGCLVTTNSVPVTVHPLPNPIIIRNGMLLSVPVAYSSYQWYLYNSPIPGANQSSFMMTQDGVYTVEVTNSFGCKKRAAVVVVNNTGIEVTNPIAQQIKIYPNPTSDKVKIESPIPVKILVQSSAGYEIINRSDVTSLELGQLPDGVYILSIFDEDGVIIKHEKVVKSSH